MELFFIKIVFQTEIGRPKLPFQPKYVFIGPSHHFRTHFLSQVFETEKFIFPEIGNQSLPSPFHRSENLGSKSYRFFEFVFYANFSAAKMFQMSLNVDEKSIVMKTALKKVAKKNQKDSKFISERLPPGIIFILSIHLAF